MYIIILTSSMYLFFKNKILLLQTFIWIYIEDIQWFDVEYGIYFTYETEFFTFSRERRKSENIKNSCLTSEINSLSTSKYENYYLSHFPRFFSKMFLSNVGCCMQYMTWQHGCLLISHCENNKTFSHCENNSLWRYHSYSMETLNILQLKM